MHGQLGHLAVHYALEFVLLSHVLIMLVLKSQQVGLKLGCETSTQDELLVQELGDLQTAGQLDELLFEFCAVAEFFSLGC